MFGPHLHIQDVFGRLLLLVFLSPRALNLRARFARRRAVLAIIVRDIASLSLLSFSSQSLFLCI